eukprot:TRINITY_DN3166_c0_g1_i1.p1 TRINITY_DN3166_c0_g1~~TRINITY_DN3166_c0_g1_i1.p1  ORF type:complete len:567 (+),score=91.96 TRINITY_DN3166_c0_g1_i1:75-1775(+)
MAWVVLCLLLAIGAMANLKTKSIIKGISYGPVPLKTADGAPQLPEDDWMVEAAKPMWGQRGRGDLRIIKQLGANMVRLYGNNPSESHSSFLDEAQAEGLKVAPGMSDWPFYQMGPGSCRDTNYDCFQQVKEQYARNLQTGFLTTSRTYHPALEYFILINEPDLKMPPTATVGSPEGVLLMGKALISSFDAVLEAEKEANVSGNLINFTAAFSYAICTACPKYAYRPLLGQIDTLTDAMRFPEKYKYAPRNNLTQAFLTRWTNSFNTQNPAGDMRPYFLDIYEEKYPGTPIFIAEYHKPGLPLTDDVTDILSLAAGSKLFRGISFFQYQVAYWKGGSEEAFGLFGLGDTSIAEMPYYGTNYKVWCLEPAWPKAASSQSLPASLSQVYGGRGIDATSLCLPSPASVQLSAEGFAAITSQKSPQRLAAFTKRVVEHMGATVIDEEALSRFSDDYLKAAKTFADMVVAISYRPPWVLFNDAAECVADRQAFASQVASAISWVCGHAASVNCSTIPDDCKGNVFTTGDFLFSQWYRKSAPDPLGNCYFGGAAMYASPASTNSWAQACVAAL